jgi:hypothetical protein
MSRTGYGSAQDFLTGRVQRRSLNIPPTGADCAQDGSGRGALVLARERMQSIATKIRTRAALSADERSSSPMSARCRSIACSNGACARASSTP